MIQEGEDIVRPRKKNIHILFHIILLKSILKTLEMVQLTNNTKKLYYKSVL
jgi:hypothetical protein